MKQPNKKMLVVAALYGLASIIVAAGGVMGRRQASGDWARAFWGMFFYLFPVGFCMSLLLARLLPLPGQSGFGAIFQGLYHGGVLVLAGIAFFGGMVKDPYTASTNVCLTAIAGWALWMASLIVLSLIIWEHPGKKKRHRKKRMPNKD